MVFRLAQINAARSSVCMSELRTLIEKDKIDIIMIQEPYIAHNTVWPGYRIYYGAKNEEDIWTATIVRDCVSVVSLLEHISTLVHALCSN